MFLIHWVILKLFSLFEVERWWEWGERVHCVYYVKGHVLDAVEGLLYVIFLRACVGFVSNLFEGGLDRVIEEM